jgi:hypothetical protein
VDLARPGLHEDLGRLAEGAGRVADVVHDHADLVRHVADDGHLGDLARPRAALVDDGEVRAHALRELAGARHAAHVGGDDRHLGRLPVEVVGDVEGEDGAA